MLVHRFDSPALFPVGHAAAETDVKYMFFLVSTSTRFHRRKFSALRSSSQQLTLDVNLHPSVAGREFEL